MDSLESAILTVKGICIILTKGDEIGSLDYLLSSKITVGLLLPSFILLNLWKAWTGNKVLGIY